METTTCSTNQPLKRVPPKKSKPEIPAGQGKPSLQRFLLKVDGQTKGSFATRDTAEKVGLQIKQAYPVVQVAVYDATEGSQAIIGVKRRRFEVGGKEAAMAVTVKHIDRNAIGHDQDWEGHPKKSRKSGGCCTSA